MQWEEEFGFSNEEDQLLITFYMIKDEEDESGGKDEGRRRGGGRKEDEGGWKEEGGEEEKRERKDGSGWREEWQLKLLMDDFDLGVSEHYLMLRREEGEDDFGLPTCLRLRVMKGREDAGKWRRRVRRGLRGMTYCKDKFGKLFEQEKIGEEGRKASALGNRGGGGGRGGEGLREGENKTPGGGLKSWRSEVEEKIEKEVYALLLRRYFLSISDYTKNEDFLLLYFFYLQKTGREQDMTFLLSKTQNDAARLIGRRVKRSEAIKFLNDIVDFMLSEREDGREGKRRKGGGRAVEEGGLEGEGGSEGEGGGLERGGEGWEEGGGRWQEELGGEKGGATARMKAVKMGGVMDEPTRTVGGGIREMNKELIDKEKFKRTEGLKNEVEEVEVARRLGKRLGRVRVPNLGGGRVAEVKRTKNKSSSPKSRIPPSEDRLKMALEVQLRKFKADFFGFKDNQVLRNFRLSDFCPEDFVCLMRQEEALNLSEINILDESKREVGVG